MEHYLLKQRTLKNLVKYMTGKTYYYYTSIDDLASFGHLSMIRLFSNCYRTEEKWTIVNNLGHVNLVQYFNMCRYGCKLPIFFLYRICNGFSSIKWPL
jgi:hypothetical protein